MDTKLSFKTRKNGYCELIFDNKEPEETSYHPLQHDFVIKEDKKKNTAKSSKIQTKKITNITFDPLSSDPLSLTPEQDHPEPKKSSKIIIEDKFLNEWRRHRRDIVSSHSSPSNMPLISIIPGENSPRHGDTMEFLSDLESRQSDMARAWDSGDRVASLKIIIQCLKALSDTSAIQFYPAKVFHILDVLSTFLNMVEKRLDVLDPEEAREVAKNWYYKIFSIRLVNDQDLIYNLIIQFQRTFSQTFSHSLLCEI